MELSHRELTEEIIGAFFSVANELGTGFLEAVYRRALLIELRERGLVVEEEYPIPVMFHGQVVGIYKADLVVAGIVILELKIAEEITKAFDAQLLHYLRATEMEVGLILAFGSKARFRRAVMRNSRKRGLEKQDADKSGQGGIRTD